MKESNKKWAFISISKEVEPNDLTIINKLLEEHNWNIEDYQIFNE